MNAFRCFLFLYTALLFSYSAKDYSHLIGMPGFQEELLDLHFQLYKGYVKNCNELLAKIEKTDPLSYEFGALKRRLGWEFDGMRLHELYFDNLGGDGKILKKSALHQAISKHFGSFSNWKKEFVGVGLMRGIGWALLYFDKEEQKLVNVWINEHDTGHFAGCQPILIMDVFEHAYMPQWGLARAQYIEAFFNNIDWNIANLRFSSAQNFHEQK